MIAKTCYGTKCMQHGCTELAAHKVGEYNLWDKNDSEEAKMHSEFNMRHEYTTYLCKKHFEILMKRDEAYYTSDPRFTKAPL